MLGLAPLVGLRTHALRPPSSRSWHPLTGGGTDIYKCFDQVPFEMLLDLLWAGGCPPQVVRAIQSFHTAIVYHNSVAGSIGNHTAISAVYPKDAP